MNITKQPDVLVVDDEPRMRDTLVAILELQGYCVSSAPDGETACAAVQDGSFDVVVMDIRMPGLVAEASRAVKDLSQVAE